MSETIVRKAKLEDRYSIIKLLIPSFEGRSNDSLDQGDYFRKWLVNFEKMLSSPLVHVFVAVDKDDQPVGVSTAYLLPRLELAGYYSVIEDVYVKESLRSKGMGTLLFNEIIKLLKEEGVKYATLNVAKDNVKGQEFYKRLGFKNKAMEMSLNLEETF